ncbi:MAG: hypothetical protein R2699_06575 [Acidimicrobiales bacterium]
MPACWALSLNELLAALFVLVAVAIVGRGLPGWGGLLAVGVCLGLAGLGRPDALFGLVVLGAVVAVRADVPIATSSGPSPWCCSVRC